jgi:type VI secretion system protein
MHKERLTERIRSQEHDPMRHGGENCNRCIDSILAHLQRILNTRQGNVPISDEYGIPDFVNLLQTYPDSVHHIEASIRNAINRYEPRLTGTSVTCIPREDDDLTLRFQILSCLVTDGDQQVLLETVVGTDGKVCVRR